LANVFILSINRPRYFGEDTNNSKFYLRFISWNLPAKAISNTCNIRIIVMEYNISRNINIEEIKIKITIKIQVKGFFDLKLFKILFLDND
jgi:hypothetical protein